MQERRRGARIPIFKAAQLITSDRRKVIGCTVRDLSAGGACIDVADAKGIPHFLSLSFDWLHTLRPCEVRWRSGSRIGLAFR
jgi:hypothetical protein